jgi:hypothetical protein
VRTDAEIIREWCAAVARQQARQWRKLAEAARKGGFEAARAHCVLGQLAAESIASQIESGLP